MAMRVTSKGQVTIPIEMRRRYGIKTGAEVAFEASDRGLVIVVPEDERSRAFREALGRMKGSMDLGGMTTDEYMNWLRGYDEDDDDPGFAP
jgi:AbrB family looped-hinge helix DNA binding protein